MNKEAFAASLSRRGCLWSYDPEKVALLPDAVLIEHALVYGDVPDIENAFVLFGKPAVEAAWRAHVLPDARFRKLNNYLARIYFGIKNPAPLLDQAIAHETRLARLQRLAAEDV